MSEFSANSMEMTKRESELAPLLVQLYDTHRIYQEGEGDKAPCSHEMAQIATDLLKTSHKAHERELVADILISLLRQAQNDLKEALADRLSLVDDVPLRLVLQMAQDEISVAEKILKNSPVLNDLDLLYLIQSRDSPYWQAIAARKKMSGTVMDALTDTKDVKTACVLTGNEAITLTSHSMQVIADMAQKYEEIARPLLQRKELPEGLAQKIYMAVSEELKAELREAMGRNKVVIAAAQEVFLEFTDTTDEYMPSDAMLKAADLFFQRGQISTELMLKTLNRGQVSSFIAQFSRLSHITPRAMIDTLMQEHGQSLAILCRSLGMELNVFENFYLYTQKLRSEDGVVNPSLLYRAREYFEKLDQATARRLHEQLCKI